MSDLTETWVTFPLEKARQDMIALLPHAGILELIHNRRASYYQAEFIFMLSDGFAHSRDRLKEWQSTAEGQRRHDDVSTPTVFTHKRRQYVCLPQAAIPSWYHASRTISEFALSN
jgi:hypothetical protein